MALDRSVLLTPDPMEHRLPRWAQDYLSALRAEVRELERKVGRVEQRAGRVQEDFAAVMDLLHRARGDGGSLGEFARRVTDRHALDGVISAEEQP